MLTRGYRVVRPLWGRRPRRHSAAKSRERRRPRSMPWWYRRPHTTSVQASREAAGPAGVALLYSRGFAMLTRGGSNFSLLSFGLIRPDQRSFLPYLPEKWRGNAGCFVNTTPCKRFLTFRGGKIGSHILPLHIESWFFPEADSFIVFRRQGMPYTEARERCGSLFL